MSWEYETPEIWHASAKINLLLRVGARRSDGYHDIQSVMQKLDLADELMMTPLDSPAGVSLEIQAPVFPGLTLSSGPDNLVQQAYVAYQAQAQETLPHLKVCLKKTIPTQAGLGGGSSDAACMLLYLNAHVRAPLSLPQLNEIAMRLGADVPFFLRKESLLLAQGIGEILSPLPSLPPLFVLLLKPEGHGISTPEAFAALSGRYADRSPVSLDDGLKLFKEEKLQSAQALCDLLTNDFEALALETLPILKTAYLALESAGFCPALSGTGPTLYVVHEPVQRQALVRCFEEIQALCGAWWSVWTHFKVEDLQNDIN